MGVMNPGLVMRNIIPVVMAGVLGIYGLIVAVILSGSSELCSQQDAGVGDRYLALVLFCDLRLLSVNRAHVDVRTLLLIVNLFPFFFKGAESPTPPAW